MKAYRVKYRAGFEIKEILVRAESPNAAGYSVDGQIISVQVA
jgi:hypothetical protein